MASKKASAKMKRKSGNGKAMKRALSTPKKPPAIKDPLSKGAMIKAIMDMTELSKREVSVVLETLTTLIEHHVKSKGPGKFVMPGLMKIVVVKKPATPARKGINPFTGEPTVFKAKPARKVVKIKALKKLKEMAIQ
ncbi:integration host factor [Gammaproteobacteria bacterium SCGC AG-212-F23]|nr:integration host factor [Gammaproteobacteria bacterium SCGC AG-212-F23]